MFISHISLVTWKQEEIIKNVNRRVGDRVSGGFRPIRLRAGRVFLAEDRGRACNPPRCQRHALQCALEILSQFFFKFY